MTTTTPSTSATGHVIALAPRNWRIPTLLAVLSAITVVAFGIFGTDTPVSFGWSGNADAIVLQWSHLHGLEPEAGREITPAPAEEHVLAHPRAAVAEVLRAGINRECRGAALAAGADRAVRDPDPTAPAD